MVTELISIIKDLGFPIAAYLLMYKQNNTTLKQNTEALNKIKIVLAQLGGKNG